MSNSRFGATARNAAATWPPAHHRHFSMANHAYTSPCRWLIRLQNEPRSSCWLLRASLLLIVFVPDSIAAHQPPVATLSAYTHKKKGKRAHCVYQSIRERFFFLHGKGEKNHEKSLFLISRTWKITKQKTWSANTNDFPRNVNPSSREIFPRKN